MGQARSRGSLAQRTAKAVERAEVAAANIAAMRSLPRHRTPQQIKAETFMWQMMAFTSALKGGR